LCLHQGQAHFKTKKKQPMDARIDQANRDVELEAELKEMERLHEHDLHVREVAYLESKMKLEADILKCPLCTNST
jgi:hypothetical protein